MRPRSAAIAFRQEAVLPVRNRLHRDIPDRLVQQAKREVVDRDFDAGRAKHVHAAGEIGPIIERVNPQQVLIG